MVTNSKGKQLCLSCRMETGMKYCVRCDTLKPHTDYYGSTTSSDGLGTYCKPCGNAATYASNRKNLAGLAASQRKHKYGLDADKYAAMDTAQEGKCFVCGQPETALSRSQGPKSLSVDHCHDTGVVRKLLCDSCNRGLGYFKHDPDLLVAAAAYLIAHETADAD